MVNAAGVLSDPLGEVDAVHGPALTVPGSLSQLYQLVIYRFAVHTQVVIVGILEVVPGQIMHYVFLLDLYDHYPDSIQSPCLYGNSEVSFGREVVALSGKYCSRLIDSQLKLKAEVRRKGFVFGGLYIFIDQNSRTLYSSGFSQIYGQHIIVDRMIGVLPLYGYQAGKVSLFF